MTAASECTVHPYRFNRRLCAAKEQHLPEFLDRDGYQVAFEHQAAATDHSKQRTGVLFCAGFRSDMQGNKAVALARACSEQELAFTRFDYCGHGQSGGEFIKASIDTWLADTLAVLDHVCRGPQIMVGSSMGAWLSVLAALHRPARLKGLITIAAAPDFTHDLLPNRLTPDERQQLADGKVIQTPSAYGDGPYPISPELISGSEKHLVLHGDADTDVPWRQSHRLMENIDTRDCRLTLIKDGDHRLSEDAHLQLLIDTVMELAGT